MCVAEFKDERIVFVSLMVNHIKYKKIRTIHTIKVVQR